MAQSPRAIRRTVCCLPSGVRSNRLIDLLLPSSRFHGSPSLLSRVSNRSRLLFLHSILSILPRCCLGQSVGLCWGKGKKERKGREEMGEVICMPWLSLTTARPSSTPSLPSRIPFPPPPPWPRHIDTIRYICHQSVAWAVSPAPSFPPLREWTKRDLRSGADHFSFLSLLLRSNPFSSPSLPFSSPLPSHLPPLYGTCVRQRKRVIFNPHSSLPAPLPLPINTKPITDYSFLPFIRYSLIVSHHSLLLSPIFFPPISQLLFKCSLPIIPPLLALFLP